MSYLLLHIDTEFIVGTIYADNGTLYPVTNGKEELLWLYFFNNPHQNSISLGKDNKTHFNNLEVNYYGRFFEKIEKEHETFSLRGIEHPIIDLLKESGLIENLRKAYQQKTLENALKIPTLISFSATIGDNPKQKTIDYLVKQGFQIDSFTIPLAELTCFYNLQKKSLNASNGSAVVFLEATNSTLHLMKLTLSDNYYLLDGNTSSWRGKGIDPRKRALARFVVNEVNKATALLYTEDEKEYECERLEMYADEWLKRLDAQTRNMPLRIPSISFSKAPSMTNDVLVRKDDLDSDTGQYTQDLRDIYETFKSDCINGDIAGVFLLGNCFQSERVKVCFEQMIGKDKLKCYTSKDIPDILAMYPKIDINRYASEETRIKERAKAGEQKLALERASEDQKRKEQEAEQLRIEAEQKAEANRKEAKKLFERAVELEKIDKLEDARVNVENAIELDNTNKVYKQFFDDLKDKIKNLIEKTELYKKYLSNADNFLGKGDLEKALDKYEEAKYVFDNAEIIAKIIEVKRLVKEKEKQKSKITQLTLDAKQHIQLKDFQKAKSIINEISSIDKTNSDATKLLTEIDQILKQQETQFNDFVKSADMFFDANKYVEATNAYNQALILNPDSSYCKRQLENINEKVHLQKANKEKFEKITEVANNLFESQRWDEAQAQYEIALSLYPEENTIQNKIKFCMEKLKAQEDTFKGLIADAIFAKKEGKLKEALSFCETALIMRPNDKDVKNRLDKIKFEIQFDTEVSSKTTQKITNTVTKTEDNFFGNNKTTEKQKSIINDDFLSEKSNKTLPIRKEENNFILKKPKKSIDDVDEFLGKKK